MDSPADYQSGRKKGRSVQNILVIFEATQESTESLALALGLGAVQQGANIRLRHLDPSPAAKLAHQSYGRLKVDDLRWAEAIAVVLETGSHAAVGEIEQILDQLSEAASPTSKIALVSCENAENESVRCLREKLQQDGFLLFSEDMTESAVTPASMTRVGQRLAEAKI
jgi:flavorubredoxin